MAWDDEQMALDVGIIFGSVSLVPGHLPDDDLFRIEGMSVGDDGIYDGMVVTVGTRAYKLVVEKYDMK